MKNTDYKRMTRIVLIIAISAGFSAAFIGLILALSWNFLTNSSYAFSQRVFLAGFILSFMVVATIIAKCAPWRRVDIA